MNDDLCKEELFRRYSVKSMAAVVEGDDIGTKKHRKHKREKSEGEFIICAKNTLGPTFLYFVKRFNV